MDIHLWAEFRVYQDPDAGEKIPAPLHYCQYTVKAWKRAIPSFMLNTQMHWNETAGIGNPTRSAIMAKLLKNIAKYQK